MTPTRPWVLLALLTGCGAVTALVVHALDSRLLLPSVPVAAVLPMVFLALLLLYWALFLRGRLRRIRERRPDARPVNPLVAAGAAVLGKASAQVGALVAGGYAGYGLYLLPGLDRTGLTGRALVCGGAALAALGMAAAGLFLEWVLRLPPSGPEEAGEPAAAG